MLNWRRDWLALALSLALLLAVDFALSSFWTCAEVGQQTSQHTQSQQYEKRCTGFAGPLVLSVRSAGTWFVETLRDEGNAVIAFFTIALVVSTTLLWISAERSADAANRSARIAEDSLFKLQRASVFVADFEWKWHSDIDRPGKFWWHFRPIWHNSGNTETRNMTTNVVFRLRDSPLPKDYNFPPNEESSPAIIPPHWQILGAMGILTDEDFAAVQAGTKYFYSYGTISYRDVFDGTPTHTTTFCRQITNVYGDVMHPDMKDNVVTMFFAIVFPEHNTAA